MLDDSLFVSAELHEREVQIGKSKKVKLHFRELPAVEFIRFHSAQSQANADAKAGAAAKLIAACVCNADGSPAMSYEKALTLKTGALNAIFAVVMEINGSESGNA
jgi:Phage tail assembly chaperone, TAC